jgi:hypothetical protein
MADIERNLNKFNNTQIVKIILLFNKRLNIIISRGSLKLEIFSPEVYKVFVRQIVKLASIQTNITNKIILKHFRNIIFLYTIKDKLFPITFENLTLEIINLLLYTCISFPTRKY